MSSLINRVSDVRLESRKNKAGKDYSALVIELDDGYKVEKPVSGEVACILDLHFNDQILNIKQDRMTRLQRELLIPRRQTFFISNKYILN